MSSVISYFKKKPHLLILIFILIIGLFFRTYKIVERFEFAHDGDLYSWIVKDIVINHHFRLIGQLTSVPGIFIGPLFYYLLIPFFILTKMDPVGALILVTLIGLSTILSYYFVLSKIFTKEAGLIGAFLYSVLIVTANSDRWVVPTVTTSLWAIWYFYSLVMLSRGNFFILAFLGILVALVWHIHIALIPALAAIPVAILISQKLPKFKQILYFLITFFITSLPLIIFEIRHQSGQTLSLFNNFTAYKEGLRGFDKLQQVLEMITKNTNSLLFAPQSFHLTNSIFFILAILVIALLITKTKVITIKELIPLYVWIISIILAFSISRVPISEYYFINIGVIFIVIFSLFLYLIFRASVIGKFLVIGLLSLIFLKNVLFFITQNYYNKGYIEKQSIVKFIKQDAKQKGYPCVGISYITTPGENVGFRYLFYLNNVRLTHPSLDVPVYNIFIPEEFSKDQEKLKFGHIAVALPANIPAKEIIARSCQTPNTNLTDSMLGFVN